MRGGENYLAWAERICPFSCLWKTFKKKSEKPMDILSWLW